MIEWESAAVAGAAHTALRGLLAAAVAAIGAGLLFWWYRSMTRRQFGGITGDLAGWFLQRAELWMLAALAVSQWGGVL